MSLLRPAAATPLASIAAHTVTKLLLYPNPAQTTVTVELPTTLNLAASGCWVLFGSTGAQLRTAAVTSHQFTLDLAELPPDIYQLEVLVDKTRLTSRLVKQ